MKAKLICNKAFDRLLTCLWNSMCFGHCLKEVNVTFSVHVRKLTTYMMIVRWDLLPVSRRWCNDNASQLGYRGALGREGLWSNVKICKDWTLYTEILTISFFIVNNCLTLHRHPMRTENTYHLHQGLKVFWLNLELMWSTCYCDEEKKHVTTRWHYNCKYNPGLLMCSGKTKVWTLE